jgi:hypothetical protein
MSPCLCTQYRPRPNHQQSEDLELGGPVVSSQIRPDFDLFSSPSHAQYDPAVRPLPNSLFAPPENRDAVGPTPSLADVLGILHEANRAYDKMLDEAGWNASVHYPLLKLAIHGSLTKRRKVLVDFEMWYVGRVCIVWLLSSCLPDSLSL